YGKVCQIIRVKDRGAIHLCYYLPNWLLLIIVKNYLGPSYGISTHNIIDRYKITFVYPLFYGYSQVRGQNIGSYSFIIIIRSMAGVITLVPVIVKIVIFLVGFYTVP